MNRTNQHESEYQAIFLASLDAIIVAKPSGEILAANPAACQSLGRSEDELKHLGREGVVRPGDPDVARALEVRRVTGSFRGELTFVRANGETFPAEITTTVFGVPPEPERTVMIFRDVSDRKRTEARLLASEEKFARAFYTSPDGITITRRSDGRYLEINPGFTATSGYTPEEVLGHTPLELGIWTTADQRDRFVRELQEKGEVVNWLIEFRFKGGRLRNTLVSARPLEVDGVPCILSVTRDITELKRLEDSLVKTQRLESLGLLAGGIAHDFNNMLAGLLGFMELAKESEARGDHERVLGYLEKALGTYHRARGLTQQLLTFSKGGDPVRTTVDIGTLVRNSVSFSLSGSLVLADLVLADDLWRCHCDEAQIGQVIDNLVLNAVQAMPGGGVVHVVARNTIDPDDHKGRFVEVSIRDEGPGIDPGHLGRIFDPFFTTKETGHGLGLATVFSILRRHEGWVEVASPPGQGACFSLFLPAASLGLEAASTSPDEILHRGHGRVLVMDDDTAIVEVLAQWLESMGYRVDTCGDGTEALRRLTEAWDEGKPFRAALLDLTVPGDKGGVEILQALGPSHPALVLIATTGYSEAPVSANPEAFGFTARLVKPFHKAELAQLLETLL